MHWLSERPPRLIVLAIDGLDWGLLRRLGDQGALPFFSQLSANGSWVPFGVQPVRCHESDWATIATGVLPDRHGILAPVEAIPGTPFVRSVTSSSCGIQPFWSICAQAGRKVAAIGWPATHGLTRQDVWVAAPGVEVAPPDPRTAWCLDPAGAAPACFADLVHGNRLRPAEIGLEELEFLSGGVDASRRELVLPKVAQAVAQASARHAWATHALCEQPSDVLMLHLSLVSQLADALSMEQSAGSEEQSLGRGYQFLDLLLGRLMSVCGPEARYLVVTHGAHRATVRTQPRGDQRAFMIVAGAGVAKRRQPKPLAAVQVFDVMLALAQIETGDRAMPSAVAELLPDDATAARTLVARPTTPRVDCRDLETSLSDWPGAEAAAAMQLAPAADWTSALEHSSFVRAEAVLALAQLALHQGQRQDAIALLEGVTRRNPSFVPAWVALARMHWRSRDVAAFENLLSRARTEFVQAPLLDLGAAMQALLSRQWADFDAQVSELMARRPWLTNLHALIGASHMARRSLPAAVSSFEAALAMEPEDTDLWIDLADAMERLGAFDKAIEAYRCAVSLRPTSRALLLKLSDAQRRNGELSEASATMLLASQVN